MIDNMLRHKTSLSKFKKIEIICILSDYSGMKLEINYKKTGKVTNRETEQLLGKWWNKRKI